MWFQHLKFCALFEGVPAFGALLRYVLRGSFAVFPHTANFTCPGSISLCIAEVLPCEAR